MACFDTSRMMMGSEGVFIKVADMSMDGWRKYLHGFGFFLSPFVAAAARTKRITTLINILL